MARKIAVGLVTTAWKNVMQNNLNIGNVFMNRVLSLLFDPTIYNGNRIPDSLY